MEEELITAEARLSAQSRQCPARLGSIAEGTEIEVREAESNTGKC